MSTGCNRDELNLDFISPTSELKAADQKLKGKFVVAWIGKMLPDGTYWSSCPGACQRGNHFCRKQERWTDK